MPLIQALAVILLIAAVISLILSFLGLLIVGALRLLPIVFIVLAVLFFLKGGRIKISREDWPANKDR